MRAVIQKFGGTSLATAADRNRVVDRVLEAMENGLSPVVVVSAMGRNGDPYATDTLVGLARAVYPETAPREMDLLASCGEIISAVVMANTLKKAGIDASAMTGGQAGIVTDGEFTNARIIRVDPTPLRTHLEEGTVAVVCGFQGVSQTGEVTTLGRGGSDTTAAALGVALRAEEVEIYTDVDGIKTADPHMVPEARTMDTITYEEICQLAHEGAKVVHPRAVELAMRGSLPMRIRSSAGGGAGTLVTRGYDADGAWPAIRDTEVIAGVTHLRGLAQVAVRGPLGSGQSGRLFRSLAEAGISVDLINASPERHVFCILEDRAGRAVEILGRQGLDADVRRGCSKVSVVGAGMRGVPGVMASVAEALAGAGVDILQTADSHLTITCLIDDGATEAAVRSLHSRFGLDREREQK